MPLIKCPMCGKEISSNAVSCPHCGEPIKKTDEIDKNHCSLVLTNTGGQYIKVIKRIREITGYGLEAAKNCTDCVPSIIMYDIDYDKAEEIKKSFEELGASMKICPSGQSVKTTTTNLRQPLTNTITCPNCHSTKVHKIGGLSKAGSVAMWGIFAMGKVSKTYECKKCGYRW